MTARRVSSRRGSVLWLFVLVASGCSPALQSASQSSRVEAPSDGGQAGPSRTDGDLTEIIAAAQAEGTLTTIGLRHDWCNFGEQIETFKARYGLKVNELDQDASFSDQLEAIRANRDNRGPLAPDVIDVSHTFGPQARAEKLIQPFQLSTADRLPDVAKDPDGYWYAGHYAVLAFETNADVVSVLASDWGDLLDPVYRGQVALAGDPRVGRQAIATIYAAALANGGSLDDPRPGLSFFKKLHESGNLLAAIADSKSVETGATPITIRWTDIALSHQDVSSGEPKVDVTVPATGRLAALYAQAISAFAPHPNAARLWLEFLHSDEGQTILLEGRCHPIHLGDLTSRGILPVDALSKMPETIGATFPTAAQFEAATLVITKDWDTTVGVDIK